MVQANPLLQINVHVSGARVTHYGLNQMEVCAPAEWPMELVGQFATFKLACISGHQWQVSADQECCTFEGGFAHFQVYAAKDVTTPLELDSQPPTPVCQNGRALHVKAIVNFLGAVEAGELEETAESLEVLTQWLRIKALAVEARKDHDIPLAVRYECQSEALYSRLLAQFRGTLVVI